MRKLRWVKVRKHRNKFKLPKQLSGADNIVLISENLMTKR